MYTQAANGPATPAHTNNSFNDNVTVTFVELPRGCLKKNDDQSEISEKNNAYGADPTLRSNVYRTIR